MAICELALVTMRPLAGQDTLRIRVQVGTEPLRGRVTSSVSARAVPFTLLALDHPRLDFFGSEDGSFRLPALDRGEHRLLVRQLGFKPLEVVLVAGAANLDTLALVIEPRALILPTLVATACATVIDLEPGVRGVLEAASENARRLDLMQRDYPYAARYQQVREVYARDGSLVSRTPSRQELAFWEKPSYRPGHAIVPAKNGAVDVAYFSATALLADNFRKTHCFRFGGVDTTESGARMLTLEFEPLSTLSGPDWEGRLVLDERGVLRKSEARLVARKPKDNWPTSALCRVEYEVVGESLPVESVLVCRLRMGEPYVTEALEEWRLECQRFVKKVPGVESGFLPDSAGVWRGRLCRER
jgi:hypothetical protein